MADAKNQQLEPYVKLAETLNKIPNGYASTPDGTHLRVLQWIFDPDEAELASKLKLMAETVEEISKRLGIPLEGLKDKLEIMHNKGQINVLNTSTGRRYGLLPFAVGIYEEQLDRMDEEFAALIEEYFQKSTGQGGIFESEPAIFQIIPVNQVIDRELEIYPYEQAENIINNAKSWGVRDCICKEQQELIGEPCSYPKTVCLNFSKKENHFDGHRLTKPITKEEALEYLKKAEEAGLIHCSMNVKTGHYYICNCCTCCCGVLRSLTERNVTTAFVKANYIMEVDEDLCVGCETCVDRCQFNALEVIDGLCEVNLKRCVGCGVCALVCPEDAMQLVERAVKDKNIPPDNERDWMTQKAMSRQVDPSDLL